MFRAVFSGCVRLALVIIIQFGIIRRRCRRLGEVIVCLTLLTRRCTTLLAYMQYCEHYTLSCMYLIDTQYTIYCKPYTVDSPLCAAPPCRCRLMREGVAGEEARAICSTLWRNNHDTLCTLIAQNCQDAEISAFYDYLAAEETRRRRALKTLLLCSYTD